MAEPYYAGCNPSLLRAVPAGAMTILDVGCGEGRLGAALKLDRPDRTVIGVERQRGAAGVAETRLDRVFTLDIGHGLPELEAGSVDCILFGDILEHLPDPEGVLRRFRPLLAPGGCVLASIPNMQHHSLLAALLTGDFQYTDEGLLDATHLRFFTQSTILKLFLDAGYAPAFADSIATGCPPALVEAARPLLELLGLHPGRVAAQLGVYQYIVRARPLETPDEAAGDTMPLSFVVCVSNEAILHANLLASPCLRPGTPHEVIAIRGAASAAAGLNLGLERAKHELVVCLHQDVYLPRGWDRQVVRQVRLAGERLGPLGVAGVYGVGEVSQTGRGTLAAARIGRVIDRDRLLEDGPGLPAAVSTLDELLLVLPRGTGLRFEPSLGFHLYGADICLKAQKQGLAVAALDALCLHNSRSVGLPEAFGPSAARFARQWADRLPVATPCVVFDPDGRMSILGNAEPGPKAMALAAGTA